MKVRLIVAGAAAALVVSGIAGVNVAVAAPKAKPTTSTTVAAPKAFLHVGAVKVVSVATRELTITVKNAKAKAKATDVKVKVAPDAKITRNGKAVKLDGLKVGDQVQARGTGGTATRITAEAKKPAATTTTTTTAPVTTTTAPGGTATP